MFKRAQCLQNIVEFIRQRAESKETTENNVISLPISSASDLQAEGALKLATILLQAAVNGIYDNNTTITPAGLEAKLGGGVGSNTVRHPGLKQRLEKKEGLFRMHMMGKRVNFACRSVISPDPNLSVTEVGVPLFFATRLTYPVPVTIFNLSYLRQLVKNGPNVYPGARSLQMPDGRLTILPKEDTPQARNRREMIARRLAPLSAGSNGIPTIVSYVYISIFIAYSLRLLCSTSSMWFI